MIDQKPCLPECHDPKRTGIGASVQPHISTRIHAPACPKAEPAPAPKVTRCACGKPAVGTFAFLPVCQSCFDDASKPAPAEAPKVSEENRAAIEKMVKCAFKEAQEAEDRRRSVPRRRCPHCGMTQNDMMGLGDLHVHIANCVLGKPAPAEAPKACPRCGVPFSRRGIYHSEGGCYETGIRKPAPAPASVPPASDEEIADTKARAVRVTAIGSVRALKLIASIEQEKAQNTELREEGQKLKTSIDDLKRTVTEASMRRHEEIASLRARLAEVSEAARAVVTTRNDRSVFDYEDLDVPITALETILAKGDSK